MSHDIFYIYDYKEDFDFFDEPLPENHALFAFGDQLSRLRLLLESRSREQINYIIESLDWMLKEGSVLLDVIINEKVEIEGQAFSNRVKALKSYAEVFDITEQESLPNATWTDYFAVLSLVTILEVLHEVDFSGLIYSDCGPPMEALEAVCIAEFYKELSDNSTNGFKKRGQAGGKKRASKFDHLMKKVLSKYDATPRYQDISNRQAARFLMKDFEEEIAETLSGSEPRETLERWIGKHKKNI